MPALWSRDRHAGSTTPIVITVLAGSRGVRRAQLAIGRRPDTLDTAARANEKCRGSQRHKSHEQRVFDQVLSGFVDEKASEELHSSMVRGVGSRKKPSLVRTAVR